MRKTVAIALLRSLQVLILLGAILFSGFLAYGSFLRMGRTDCGRSWVQEHFMQLRCALDVYRIDTGAYPTTDQGMAALARPTGVHGPYLMKVPLDAWDREWVYRSNGKMYERFSKGPDGRAGTSDDIHDEMRRTA